MAKRRRRSPAKGWKKVAPRTVAERAALPRGCFLDSAREAYPVCTKFVRRRVVTDCRGLLAAKERAAKLHHKSIVTKADRLAARKGCAWVH